MSERAYVKGRQKDFHVEVWESVNGPVSPGFVVHHIDHDKKNNDISNLMLMTHQQHSEHHNQKHSITKNCEVCGTEFTPHPTKRARQKACCYAHARVLMSRAAIEREARKRAADA